MSIANITPPDLHRSTQRLFDLANANFGEIGQSPMSANEVIVMLAHILSDQETFQLARTDLDPRFFEQFDEQLLINVWESAVALFDRHGEPPTLRQSACR